MFEITIKGETLEEFHANLQQLAAQFGGVPTAAPKPRGTRKNVPAQPTADASDDAAAFPTADEEQLSAEDAAIEADLRAPVEPMPDTAKQVVDAGTGAVAASDEPIKLTMDDVRKYAAKLASTDSSKLAELLKKQGAAKLSEVPKGKLADFAADVMEALG